MYYMYAKIEKKCIYMYSHSVLLCSSVVAIYTGTNV